jgi:ribosomal protein S18 acetylase RimI-like enzyme
MRFTLFEDSNLFDLHTCFEKSFSDYAVPFKLSFESFRRRIYEKTNINAQYSVLIWDEKKLIGFILHSSCFYQNEACIYNGGTGVLQEYRGMGLVKKAYEWIIPTLKSDGISSITLEVIQSNLPAIFLYSSLGFEQSKSFDCFKMTKEISANTKDIKVVSNDVWNLNKYSALQQYQPSFIDQNESLIHNAENELILEAYQNETMSGYAVFQPRIARISQIGWLDCEKDQEIVLSLLKSLEKRTFGKIPITLMNINNSNETIINFLRSIGFETTVKQFEMILKLN